MDERPEGTYEGFEGRVRSTFRSSESWWPPRVEAGADAPNVVLVLVDDLGFSDLGCYGSEIPTPHIDALAERGVRYANFHVTPLCSPTRAALLTGRNSHAVGVGFVAHVNPGFPGYVSELPENQPTLAEVFRHNGYSTLMVGKWHLTNDAETGEAGNHASWPLQRGFDEFYGILDALTNFHHPHRLHDGNSVVHVDEYPEGYYLTDDLTDRAIRMIHGVKANNPRKPFFLYVAHPAVHAPLHAPREDIERHRGNYDLGWDELRERRLARQKELGVVAPSTRLPERNTEQNEDVAAWETVPDEHKPLYARYMEVYAAMVETVDRSVGRIVATLEELGELDNTVIVVTSDNGASREGQATGSTNYGRGSTPEPGKRRFDGDALAKDLERMDHIGGPNSWPHYPRGWAMACNTPFRLYKTTTFAGGHQVPLVFSWPRRLTNHGSIVSRQFAHVTDILPTLVDLVGLAYPSDRHGLEPDELAGVSFAETLHDETAPTRHTEQYYECIGARALYHDGWEAVTYRIPGIPFSEERWHLFHTAEDPTQIDDLAETHPDRLDAMKARWEELAWENQVFPV
jgi:arylsulfatase A-like enzyme